MPELCDCNDEEENFREFISQLRESGREELARRTGLESLTRNDVTWEFEFTRRDRITRETYDPDYDFQYNNPDYVSPAVARAARVHAESAKLLGDHIDEFVFGPDPNRSGHRQTSNY
jgi:hypothetical protein